MSLLKTTKIFCKNLTQGELMVKTLLEMYPQADQGYIQDVFKKYLDPKDLPCVTSDTYNILTPAGKWVEAEFSSAREDYRYIIEFENGTEATLSEFNLQPVKKYIDEDQVLLKVNELKTGYWCPFFEDNLDNGSLVNYYKIKNIKFRHPFDDLIRVWINDPTGLFILANGLITHI